jgi:hypothetical protein
MGLPGFLKTQTVSILRQTGQVLDTTGSQKPEYTYVYEDIPCAIYNLSAEDKAFYARPVNIPMIRFGFDFDDIDDIQSGDYLTFDKVYLYKVIFINNIVGLNNFMQVDAENVGSVPTIE